MSTKKASKSAFETVSNFFGVFETNFNRSNGRIAGVSTTGGIGTLKVDSEYYIVPVISLNNYATISKGTGSETDPWIVD